MGMRKGGSGKYLILPRAPNPLQEQLDTALRDDVSTGVTPNSRAMI